MVGQVPAQLEPWCDLHNKVVLITGASSGLGRDFCLDLAKSGCRILAAARRVGRLKSLCEEINQLPSSANVKPSTGLRAVAVELDVCVDGVTIDKSVQSAWEALGESMLWLIMLVLEVFYIFCLDDEKFPIFEKIYGVVSGSVKTPLDLSEEEWNHVIRTNLTGSWLVSKSVCLRMRDAKQGGSIINISSIAGLDRGQLPGAVAYASSKAGLNAMTKVMALELGVHKIRVNSISPGLFKSEITEHLMQKDWLTNVAKKIVPLRTHGASDPALTSLVRYLIHDSSEYVSGNIFIIDAGATLPGVPIFSSL
uniref:2,4-dienoyl-CoA reductase n=1 Tax=Jatropha curcas TaxID=180498 RepID=C5MQH0_JATCU|nr:carbonyl reductase [NADPH] 2-like [Jatropha curcas]ACS12983.1 2,4-dienoyl-CoA reductase [Jatropha curcas]